MLHIRILLRAKKNCVVVASSCLEGKLESISQFRKQDLLKRTTKEKSTPFEIQRFDLFKKEN